jgi:hypothetical protein
MSVYIRNGPSNHGNQHIPMPNVLSYLLSLTLTLTLLSST